MSKMAMERYGSDKPDLRFGMELMDISEHVKGSDFKVFKSVLENGGQVKVINVEGYANIPRRELDGLVQYVQGYGAKGLAWIPLSRAAPLPTPCGLRILWAQWKRRVLRARIPSCLMCSPTPQAAAWC